MTQSGQNCRDVIPQETNTSNHNTGDVPPPTGTGLLTNNCDLQGTSQFPSPNASLHQLPHANFLRNDTDVSPGQNIPLETVQPNEEVKLRNSLLIRHFWLNSSRYQPYTAGNPSDNASSWGSSQMLQRNENKQLSAIKNDEESHHSLTVQSREICNKVQSQPFPRSHDAQSAYLKERLTKDSARSARIQKPGSKRTEITNDNDSIVHLPVDNMYAARGRNDHYHLTTNVRNDERDGPQNAESDRRKERGEIRRNRASVPVVQREASESQKDNAASQRLCIDFQRDSPEAQDTFCRTQKDTLSQQNVVIRQQHASDARGGNIPQETCKTPGVSTPWEWGSQLKSNDEGEQRETGNAALMTSQASRDRWVPTNNASPLVNTKHTLNLATISSNSCTSGKGILKNETNRQLQLKVPHVNQSSLKISEDGCQQNKTYLQFKADCNKMIKTTADEHTEVQHDRSVTPYLQHPQDDAIATQQTADVQKMQHWHGSPVTENVVLNQQFSAAAVNNLNSRNIPVRSCHVIPKSSGYIVGDTPARSCQVIPKSSGYIVGDTPTRSCQVTPVTGGYTVGLMQQNWSMLESSSSQCVYSQRELQSDPVYELKNLGTNNYIPNIKSHKCLVCKIKPVISYNECDGITKNACPSSSNTDCSDEILNASISYNAGLLSQTYVNSVVPTSMLINNAASNSTDTSRIKPQIPWNSNSWMEHTRQDENCGYSYIQNKPTSINEAANQECHHSSQEGNNVTHLRIQPFTNICQNNCQLNARSEDNSHSLSKLYCQCGAVPFKQPFQVNYPQLMCTSSNDANKPYIYSKKTVLGRPAAQKRPVDPAQYSDDQSVELFDQSPDDRWNRTTNFLNVYPQSNSRLIDPSLKTSDKNQEILRSSEATCSDENDKNSRQFHTAENVFSNPFRPHPGLDHSSPYQFQEQHTLLGMTEPPQHFAHFSDARLDGDDMLALNNSLSSSLPSTSNPTGSVRSALKNEKEEGAFSDIRVEKPMNKCESANVLDTTQNSPPSYSTNYIRWSNSLETMFGCHTRQQTTSDHGLSDSPSMGDTICNSAGQESKNIESNSENTGCNSRHPEGVRRYLGLSGSRSYDSIRQNERNIPAQSASWNTDSQNSPASKTCSNTQNHYFSTSPFHVAERSSIPSAQSSVTMPSPVHEANKKVQNLTTNLLGRLIELASGFCQRKPRLEKKAIVENINNRLPSQSNIEDCLKSYPNHHTSLTNTGCGNVHREYCFKVQMPDPVADFQNDIQPKVSNLGSTTSRVTSFLENLDSSHLLQLAQRASPSRRGKKRKSEEDLSMNHSPSPIRSILKSTRSQSSSSSKKRLRFSNQADIFVYNEGNCYQSPSTPLFHSFASSIHSADNFSSSQGIIRSYSSDSITTTHSDIGTAASSLYSVASGYNADSEDSEGEEDRQVSACASSLSLLSLFSNVSENRSACSISMKEDNGSVMREDRGRTNGHTPDVSSSVTDEYGQCGSTLSLLYTTKKGYTHEAWTSDLSTYMNENDNNSAYCTDWGSMLCHHFSKASCDTSKYLKGNTEIGLSKVNYKNCRLHENLHFTCIYELGSKLPRCGCLPVCPLLGTGESSIVHCLVKNHCGDILYGFQMLSLPRFVKSFRSHPARTRKDRCLHRPKPNTMTIVIAIKFQCFQNSINKPLLKKLLIYEKGRILHAQNATVKLYLVFIIYLSKCFHRWKMYLGIAQYKRTFFFIQILSTSARKQRRVFEVDLTEVKQKRIYRCCQVVSTRVFYSNYRKCKVNVKLLDTQRYLSTSCFIVMIIQPTQPHRKSNVTPSPAKRAKSIQRYWTTFRWSNLRDTSEASLNLNNSNSTLYGLNSLGKMYILLFCMAFVAVMQLFLLFIVFAINTYLEDTDAVRSLWEVTADHLSIVMDELTREHLQHRIWRMVERTLLYAAIFLFFV